MGRVSPGRGRRRRRPAPAPRRAAAAEPAGRGVHDELGAHRRPDQAAGRTRRTSPGSCRRRSRGGRRRGRRPGAGRRRGRCTRKGANQRRYRSSRSRPRRYSSMRRQCSGAAPSVGEPSGETACPTVAIPSTLPARKRSHGLRTRRKAMLTGSVEVARAGVDCVTNVRRDHSVAKVEAADQVLVRGTSQAPEFPRMGRRSGSTRCVERRPAPAAPGAGILDTARRSGSFPRHEEDLPTQEGEAEPHARFSQANEDRSRAERDQAPPGQGAQEAGARRRRPSRTPRRESRALRQGGAHPAPPRVPGGAAARRASVSPESSWSSPSRRGRTGPASASRCRARWRTR